MREISLWHYGKCRLQWFLQLVSQFLALLFGSNPSSSVCHIIHLFSTNRTDGGHNCVGPDKSHRSCNIQVNAHVLLYVRCFI